MPWLAPVVLENHFVSLEPAEDRHWQGLLDSASGETFKYFTSEPRPWTAEGMKTWIRTRTTEPFVTYAVIDKSDGRIVGSSTLFDASEEHRKLEIGYTWYSPEQRGTYVNPSAKLLMLTHAIETMGAVRVQLKCANRNERSKAGIVKLGAVPEGVLRNHMVLSDGSYRNTAFFSVTPAEWEQVREGLVERIARFRQ